MPSYSFEELSPRSPPPTNITGAIYAKPININLTQSTTAISKPSLAHVFTRALEKVRRSSKKSKHQTADIDMKSAVPVPVPVPVSVDTSHTIVPSKRHRLFQYRGCAQNCFTNIEEQTNCNLSAHSPDTPPNSPSKSDDTSPYRSTQTIQPQITRISDTPLTVQTASKVSEPFGFVAESKTVDRETDIESMIELKGYRIDKKLADTLQGKVYRCCVTKPDPTRDYFGCDTVVIKVTDKDLHSKSVTILENGTKKKIQENILKEAEILRKLTFGRSQRSCPYMTRFVDFFENNSSYFLVMEDGGDDLFEYVVKCHNLLKKGKIGRKEWRLVCKKIFRQIVQLLDYMQNEMRVCHLDISLENMLIKNGLILQNVQTGKISLARDFEVKFCDFGLSEQFEDNHFECTKYVGKTRYKSPELWTKKLVFDARLNDIWSLGIALFMMIMGAPPLRCPDFSDDNFKLIIQGQILQLIQSWNRAKYMTPQILDLLTQMLSTETQRISLSEIKQHSWVKLN